ncbi:MULTISPECIES: hypothetical protein [Actinomycetes]|uniref:Serine/arginine repetitive matrix protein 2 n=3 Tax=Actinomycetes TaxID=1760 RepID=W9GK71_9MICO|nr:MULTISPECIES: hypothetical protein [Actinomycetes]EWT05502.1 hypothetical protein N864_04395 [Intrasporangium chromatireducens Q5-1]QDZ14684.1 hypothetical protein FPZ11_07870 [Humibacter ginsenosidimutans]BEH02437.1 hypothetical protein brsh051_17180 [Brooklawnia sp. SH051]
MTTPTRTSTEQTAFGAEDFTTGEGLRALLNRLAAGGEDAWVHDPVARDLMEFAADKYRALARKHKLDTWEAVTAAFDAMQYRSTREANDPWAIITHAVRITCVYEERAQGLLCSVHQARRAHVSAFHDPERFSERDTALADYHPAFHTTDLRPSDLEPEPRDSLGSAQACMSAGSAAEDAIAMLCLLDWPTDTARAAVEHVCGALMKAGTRQSAYETLRRDRHARALLDLPRRSWAALLKALLGNPHPAYVATSSGRGVLLRLLLGETLDLLLRDDDLILALALAAPNGGGGESS